MKNKYLEEIILALSLSNLLFIRVWNLIISPSYFGTPPYGINILALMIDVFLVASVIWVGAFLARKYGDKYGSFLTKAAFLGLTAIIFKNLYRLIIGPLSINEFSKIFGKTISIIIIVVVAILLIYLLFKKFEDVIRFTRLIVLIVSPLALILFLQTGWIIFQTPFQPPAEKSIVRKIDKKISEPPKLKKRIVWIVFDEFDYSLTFEKPPSSLKIPELERFSNEAFFATNAYPPSRLTGKSLPALTMGKLVAENYEKNQNDLQLRFPDTREFISWKDSNIFIDIEKMGGTTAIVGWYHSYCRVFKEILTKCATDKTVSSRLSIRQHQNTLLESMFDYFQRITARLPIVGKFINQDFEFIETIKKLKPEAQAMAADENLSLVFIHYPVPHGPYVYDPISEQFIENGKLNYFDNVAYVDKFLGDLRRKMEKAGVWDKTIVIVSSDHWWRKDSSKEKKLWTQEEFDIVSGKVDYRIPFIIKMEKDSQTSNSQLNYKAKFNTVLSRSLLTEMLKGKVSTKEDVASWLDKNRTIGKSPY